MRSDPPGPGSVATPFGNPDGARENLDVLLERFVDFADAFGALATSDRDMRARVIVGRMGAGKTVYLRRLQATASDEASVYVDTSQSDLPSTEAVVRVCQLFPRRDLIELWRLAWSRAIARAAVAHVLRRTELRVHLSGDLCRELEHSAELVGIGRTPGTVYSHLSDILYQHDTKHQLLSYLHDSRWGDLTHFLREALRNVPPIAFYVDGVDESFAYAPSYWMPCQEGLFHAVMQWLKDQRVGGRLHVVVAVRDVVFSNVLRGEMAGKFRGEPHVRVLDWDASSLRYLLTAKIEALGPRHLARQGEVDPLVRWLGHREIHNIARDTTERTLDYLLRHLRLVPRDLVELGNALCRAVLRAASEGAPLTQEAIRRTVAAAARSFGNDQIQQVANQISADLAPERAGPHGYADFYVGGHAYLRDHIVDSVRECIGLLGVDRFDGESLHSARQLFNKQYDDQTDLATVLWQNGLLGFVGRRNGEEGTYFYSMSGLNDIHPPLGECEYVLHPCLVDAVGIRGVGPVPVSPHW